MPLPQSLRQADAARHRFVQIDRRRLVVRRAHLRHESQVARIDHEQHAGDRLDGPARTDQREVKLAPPPAADIPDGEPVGGRLELDLGQVDSAPAEVLVRDELELLVDGCEAGHHHLAVDARAAGRRLVGENVERFQRHRAIRLRVVVDVDTADIRLALVPIEAVDVELRRFVEIDRVLVHDRLGREQVHLADDARPVGRRVDDHDVLLGGGPERNLRGGEVLARPIPAPVARLADMPLLPEEREQVVCRTRPEPFARLEGQLERCRAQMGEQHVEVVRIEPRLFGAARQQERRMVDHVLVDGRTARHEHRDARALAPARPAHLLPGRGNGTRIARQHRHIEPADVDAELERIRADDAEQLAVAEPALDGPAFRGQVSAAIPAHAAARPEPLAQGFAQSGEQQLDRRSRPAEHHGLPAGAQERQSPAVRQRQRRAAGTTGRIQDRGIDKQHMPRAGRRTVPIDELRRPTGERRRELRGIADRGRAAHDNRVRSVVGTEPEQPAQHVGDVAAEDSAVCVQLVDDDDPELLEQLEPLRVVRQDPGMQHVRVRDDDLAGRPNGVPNGRRRVAVVGRNRCREARRRRQRPELGDLVLPESLGGEEQECPRGGVVRDRLQDRQGIAERLAGRGRRDHDDVAPLAHRSHGLRLVAVQLRDPARGEAVAQARVQPVGHRPEDRVPRRDHLVVHDAAPKGRFVEQIREHGLHGGRGVMAHAELQL